jgi:hypothetical protein
MAINLTAGLLLFAYVGLCGFILWFCIIADPSTSDTAYYLTVSLPDKIWRQLSYVLGKKKLNVLSAILDRALLLVYLVVVLGEWTIVFWYFYPWITISPYTSSIHKYIGYIIFAACMTSWRKACTTSPGIITAKSYPRFDHYPYDNLLFLPDVKCESTNLVRIARSKFDRLKYDQNVPRYDHFCGWVFNTIGEENYRWFLLFLAIHVGMCVYGSFVSILLFRGEIIDKKLLELTFFDRATGETFKSDWFLVIQYLFARRLMECAGLMVMFVMGLALGLFLSYHMYLTHYNMTTNEATKWEDVRAWYKKQKKEYEEAVKKGLVLPLENTSSQQQVDESATAVDLPDVDVTCTPGTRKSTQPPKSQKPQEVTYFDPGPVPKNIWNRGFIENWKEVIFPLSLRADALERSIVSGSKSMSTSSSSNSPSKKTKST